MLVRKYIHDQPSSWFQGQKFGFVYINHKWNGLIDPNEFWPVSNVHLFTYYPAHTVIDPCGLNFTSLGYKSTCSLMH